MGEDIAKAVSHCLSIFKLLTFKEQEWNGGQVQLSSVQDELSRFKVWAGSIGAHRTGRSSLEYRLRDASHIKSQVLRLLENLSELLQDANSILRAEKVPWDKLYVDEDMLDDTSRNEYPSGADELDSSIPDTELAQILRNITDITNCLLRLSVTIRNPAPHDRFRESKITDTSHYEPFDIQHVRNKFPNIHSEMSERLGRAISRRRQYFKYREAHHATLSQGLDLDTNLTEIVPKSTIASSIPEHLKSKTFNTMALDEDVVSDTGISQTSYATSVATSDKLRVPTLPTEANSGPFACPFCYMIIEVSSRSSWKRHVFRDLHPYVCLSKDCEAPDQDFGRRHQWMDHILQCHWKIWQCPSGCQSTFDSASSFKDHMAKAHSEAFPASQMDSVAKLSERPIDLEKGVDCPICDHPLKSTKQYQQHVGAHQEQLSLFALPILGKDEGLDDDSDQSKNKERKDEPDAYSEESKDFDEKAPVEFTDPVDRKFSFPWHLFTKGQTIADLVIATFEQANSYNDEDNKVRKGHYDLFFAENDTLIPRDSWDTLISPGTSIQMKWWPEEPKPESQVKQGNKTQQPHPASNEYCEYFVPGDGINREVITADIRHYLGNEALVRPGTCMDGDRIIQGYFINAYRNLTPAMIEDLKADSARWRS
ncbi:hypothetical protein HD806DRAFT_144170 [Xylariaceae sp. AK1471]|nr:hypothetical protein HD806DRAFT_144170 [Xylariaceae sp. AK1471]